MSRAATTGYQCGLSQSHSHLIEEDDDEVMTDAEVRLVKLVWDIEPETLELSALEKDGMEPCQGEEQFSVAEGLSAPAELLLLDVAQG